MDLQVGKVTGYEIKKNRDGENNVLLLQVELTDSDDIQTVEFYQASGQDSNPPLDSLVAISQAGSAWKIALAASDGIVPTSDSGAYKIYSSATGVIKAFLNLLASGLARLEGAIIEIVSAGKVDISGTTIELNGNSDFAVRFSVLQTQFNQLKSDFDSHTGHGVGSTPPASTADISGAKVDEVLLS